MIKLQVGQSTFLCDTPEEAVRIHRLVNSSGIAAPASKASIPTVKTNGTAASQFLKRLEPFVGKEINSAKLVELAGVRNTNGLGPRFRLIKKELEREGIALGDVLRKQVDGAGQASWLILRVA